MGSENLVAVCGAFDASVAILESEAEHIRVSRLGARLTSVAFWVPLTDIEDEWRWPDGTELSYGPWHRGEPNDWDGNEDCAARNWRGAVGWNDIDCTASFGFICRVSAQQN